jgi:YVTN family beta-propeller protein
MEFRILGPLEVSEDGDPVALQGSKPRALLAALLLRANEAVPTGALIDALWGDRPPDTVAKVVQTYVSQLRKALGPALETRPGAYLLRVEPGALDLDVFERRAAEGRRALAEGNAERAAGKLDEALGLWRGPALAEFRNEPFALPEQRRLDEARLAAQEDRIEADLLRGLGRELVPELEGLVAEHPLRERMRSQLMRAHYRSGRQADALRVYREGRTTLIDELGLEPGPELQELERAILVQDPELAAPAPRPSLNGHGPPRLSESSRRLRRRLGIAGAVLILAGFVAAATGFPFSSDVEVGTVPLNSVAAIDPGSGSVVAKTAVGIDPRAVAVGDGSVWIANTTDRTVSRIDPGTGALQRTVAIGVYPSDLVVSPRAVHVASGPTGQLVDIDSATNKASAPTAAGHECGGVEESIALGSGSLWLACDHTPDAVRIPLAGGTIIPFAYRAGLLTSTSADLVPHFPAIASGGGVTWLVDRTQSRLFEIDAATNQLVPQQVTVGTDPSAIALGFGSIWVANRGDGTVSRIQAGGVGRPARVQTIAVGERPVDIAAGEGAVWVANAGSGTVSRIDPATNRVTRTIDLHNSPAGIAAGAGRVWVTTAEE